MRRGQWRKRDDDDDHDDAPRPSPQLPLALGVVARGACVAASGRRGVTEYYSVDSSKVTYRIIHNPTWINPENE